MSDLKSQIFALLKKRPLHAISYKYGGSLVYYPDKKTCDASYHIGIDTLNEEYHLRFTIYDGPNVIEKNLELTEKEFMDMKWKIQDWENLIQTEALEKFKDFVESEPRSMDELLED